MAYQSLLKDKFKERQSQNPRYSLRAYARDLGISPSRLSEILNHKQGLSERGAEKLAHRLGLLPEEKEAFLLNVIAEDSRSKEKRRAARQLLDRAQSKSDLPPGKIIHQQKVRVANSNRHAFEKKLGEIFRQVMAESSTANDDASPPDSKMTYELVLKELGEIDPLQG